MRSFFYFFIFFLSPPHRGDVCLCQEACVSPEDVQLGSSWASSINCIDSRGHCNLYARDALSCARAKKINTFQHRLLSFPVLAFLSRGWGGGTRRDGKHAMMQLCYGTAQYEGDHGLQSDRVTNVLHAGRRPSEHLQYKAHSPSVGIW